MEREINLKTIALYDELPYSKEFSATVVACDEVSEGYLLELDRTLFFPKQGGQSSDIGYITDASSKKNTVSDVQIQQERIFHLVEDFVEPGTKINGYIDWEHRFSNMQQHTGEHIFTGLAHNKFQANNVGFHLSDNTVTLDLDVELDSNQIRELEIAANRVIFQDHTVRCFFPSDEELEAIDYRSKKEIAGSVRLVEIEDVDICACCAPHVKSTAAVGMLKVISFGKYKGGTRIYILCGMRALLDYQQKQNILQETGQILNCTQEDIPSKAKAIIADNKSIKYEFNQIQEKELLAKLEQFPAEMTDVIYFTGNMDMKTIRQGVNLLVEKHTGLCAIFSGDDEEGYSFIIGSSTRDCNAIVKGLKELLGAKGGGSKQMVQGSVVTTRTEIERLL